MKKFLQFMFALSLLASCAPKYTASFQNYDRNNPLVVKTIDGRREMKPLELPKTQSDITLASINSIPVTVEATPEILPVSLLEPTTLNTKQTTSVEKVEKKLNEHKVALKARTKELKNEANEGGGNAKKNGWAIVGFISSLVGLLVWSLWPFLGVFGIIASAIGLKSEKRKLAKAGLIMGIVGVALILVLFSLALGAFAAAV